MYSFFFHLNEPTFKMKKILIRRIYTIAALGVLVIASLISNAFEAQKKAPTKTATLSSAPLVNVYKETIKDASISIELSGRLSSRDRINVFSEVSGQLQSSEKQFKEGISFAKGDTLIHINDAQNRLNLSALRSSFLSLLTGLQAELATDYPDTFANWQNYISSFNSLNELEILPEVQSQKEKNFLVTKNVYNQFFNIRSQESQLRKYVIKAPFDGTIHSANTVPGTLIRVGQQIGEYVGAYHYELELGLSVNERSKIKLKDKVTLKSEDIKGTWQGEVSRIGTVIDPATQTLKIYVSTTGEDLMEGMYMKAELNGLTIKGSTLLSSHLLINNQFVYGVENDSILTKYPVTVLHENNDLVWLSGIPVNAILLAQSLTGAKPGKVVRVNSIKL